jgi:hypothetical protein
MSEKTDCPLCSKSLYYSGLKKHMFSKNHSNIWNAPSNRTRLQTCYNSGAKNTIQIKNLYICFGCKTFTRRDIPHSCPNKAKTLEFIKSILDVPVRIPEPPALPTALPPAPQVDVEKLKKEIAKLSEMLTESDGKNELVDEFQSALKFVLKFVKSENPELHETIMDNLGEDYPSVLKLI